MTTVPCGIMNSTELFMSLVEHISTQSRTAEAQLPLPLFFSSRELPDTSLVP